MKILSKNPLCFTVTLKDIENNNLKLSPNFYFKVKHRGISKEELLNTISFLENIKNNK